MKAKWWGPPEEKVVYIFCPGCEDYHHLYVGPEMLFGTSNVARPKWGFNNNFLLPTFTPSILVKTGKYASPEWYAAAQQRGDRETIEFADKTSGICHSYVTDGNIKFLNDCTHRLVGQTVPLLDIPQKED